MNIQTARHLAELRRMRGYSQEGLARRLGLSSQAISKWDRAESSTDTDNPVVLARLYRVSLNDLVGVGTDADELDIDDRIDGDAAEESRGRDVGRSGDAEREVSR